MQAYLDRHVAKHILIRRRLYLAKGGWQYGLFVKNIHGEISLHFFYKICLPLGFALAIGLRRAADLHKKDGRAVPGLCRVSLGAPGWTLTVPGYTFQDG
jgi:hypothetical protein